MGEFRLAIGADYEFHQCIVEAQVSFGEACTLDGVWREEALQRCYRAVVAAARC
jgi:hypothetical protein